jgi:uncharacterized membrane protein YraQ (UPF0718 family)
VNAPRGMSTEQVDRTPPPSATPLAPAPAPIRAATAVPAAGLAGVILPGCECGSVPIAGSLIRRGVTPAAARAFRFAPATFVAAIVVGASFATVLL